MNFALTEEQKRHRAEVRRFAQEEILPFISRMEEGEEYPMPLLRRMGSIGLMGIPVPREYGGLDLGFMSYILTIHEISKVSPAIGVILSVHTSVGTLPILQYGTEAQKRRYLPLLARGEAIGAFALTEPGAGSDARSIQTRAVKKKDRYLLTGTKQFITSGGEADLYLLFAVTNPEKREITAFLVEKGTKGFSVGKREKKMGLHGSSTTSLLLEEAEVPVENRLGEEGKGFRIAMSQLDTGRIGIAAQALGVGEAAFEAALSFAKERKDSPPEYPLEEPAWMGNRLADMAVQLEAAKLLVYRAASLKERGLPVSLMASQAKLFASDTAVRVATAAINTFGLYGMLRTYPVERFFRDAKITQIYEGTNEIQRIVVGRELFERA